ncbi:hypothetical protein CMUS01_01653 [Colletotrichum musicola]|uniref:Uncharacterized protein n=1 Tax=Colletotrichum musicola TaxID=2175873 RepID=A0A8H6U885_9PEZI|nr:hypothetical protein CMUS01_01653 [Colletotrichum musicola]
MRQDFFLQGHTPRHDTMELHFATHVTRSSSHLVCLPASSRLVAASRQQLARMLAASDANANPCIRSSDGGRRWDEPTTVDQRQFQRQSIAPIGMVAVTAHAPPPFLLFRLLLSITANPLPIPTSPPCIRISLFPSDGTDGRRRRPRHAARSTQHNELRWSPSSPRLVEWGSFQKADDDFNRLQRSRPAHFSRDLQVAPPVTTGPPLLARQPAGVNPPVWSSGSPSPASPSPLSSGLRRRVPPTPSDTGSLSFCKSQTHFV